MLRNKKPEDPMGAVHEVYKESGLLLLRDRNIFVYSFLMIATGLIIGSLAAAIWSLNYYSFPVTIIAMLGLSGLYAAHPFEFFLAYGFLAQLLVSFGSTYFNLAMLVDMRRYRKTGSSSVSASLLESKKYVKAMFLWLTPIYFLIMLYLYYIPYLQHMGTGVILIYFPASIPTAYVLLELFDKNIGPATLARLTINRVRLMVKSLRKRTAPPHPLLPLAIFAVFNGFQLAINYALNGTVLTKIIYLDSILAMVAVAIINAVSLVSYEHSKHKILA